MYKIVTDTSNNLSLEVLKKHDVDCISMHYVIGEEVFDCLNDNEEKFYKFYSFLRERKMVTTSAINAYEFEEAFRPILKEGKDVLYVGFTSGLSTTFNSARIAKESLEKEFPNNKVILVDSLCAAGGVGLLVLEAIENKEKGLSIEDNAKALEEIRGKVNHFFTVDDLFFLKRGGRISAISFTIASALKIKPVLYINEEGKIIALDKIIGRKKSIIDICDKLIIAADGKKDLRILINHGDCIEDAVTAQEYLKQHLNVKEFIVGLLDPIIGIHSGPGTLALFVIGKER